MAEDCGEIDHIKADQLMNYALEYYIKRRDVIMKKLVHARDATKQSMDDIDDASDQPEPESSGNALVEIKAYDNMWEQTIKLFGSASISDNEMGKIEETLKRIPQLIKRYYDLLVEQDKVLQALIQEISSDEYKKALSMVQEIQARPNLMSGLEPEEYELEVHVLDDEEREKALVISIPAPDKGTLH